MLKPLGMCAEYLNQEVVRSVLTTGMERSIQYVQNLEEKDFKEKVNTSCPNQQTDIEHGIFSSLSTWLELLPISKTI